MDATLEHVSLGVPDIDATFITLKTHKDPTLVSRMIVRGFPLIDIPDGCISVTS